MTSCFARPPAPRRRRSKRSPRDRRFPKVRAVLPVEISTPGRAMPSHPDRDGNDSACRLAPAGSTVRSSRRSRIAMPPARGLRSRRQPRGSAGAQTRKWTPPSDCGSAPIGRRRTGGFLGEGRCSVAESSGGVAGSCRSFVRPKPARASTSRPRASPYEPLRCAPGRLTTPAVIRSSPSNSDGTRSGCFIVVVDRTTSRMAVAI